jgi:lysozyme family protein
MKSTWALAFAELMKSEGGFTDDTRDPGNYLSDGRPGCTNLGVTQRAWENYIGRQVTHDEMRALTPETVNEFYKQKYWDAIKADDLPSGIDYMVFDTCVNSGPSKAARLLQECVGAKPDGAIGPATLAAVTNANLDKLIDDYSEARLNYMQSLTGWPVYGRGWERRVNEVAELADTLSQA